MKIIKLSIYYYRSHSLVGITLRKSTTSRVHIYIISAFKHCFWSCHFKEFTRKLLSVRRLSVSKFCIFKTYPQAVFLNIIFIKKPYLCWLNVFLIIFETILVEIISWWNCLSSNSYMRIQMWGSFLLWFLSS